MTAPINGNTRATSAAPTTPSEVHLNLTGKSTPEEVTKGLQKYGLDEASAKAYALQVGSIQSKESQSAVYRKVEQNVNKFLKANPNATEEQICAEAKKHLMAQTLMYKHVEKSIMDMAQKSIERIRDTFSENS
ncbi:hypothetical protein D187_004411 [Cystobacter fuscus DSM 2262]|uniref:Uncharacterized protein n=1 Tax=Cystobacter fuscus (strain ATCC 25194 / DSM 2262 / NBRC 100088 / M29) TaxID=1242864 RepID=S9P7F1_CYSF2|nr:hypothetical protein [Cystobacter fuscus]EPX58122.1 hypothetical protein D187_004411 [Cystobacter fuscus DSM 2262]